MNKIRLMKIVDIHPYDAFHYDLDKLRGRTLRLLLDGHDVYFSGWSATKDYADYAFNFVGVKLAEPNLWDILCYCARYYTYRITKWSDNDLNTFLYD